MKILNSVFISYISFLVIGIAYGDSNFNDTSLTEKDYIRQGIPKNIKNLEDYLKVYNAFIKLLEKDKNILPRFNSVKSGNIFQKLFNKSIVDEILTAKNPTIKKRRILLQYLLMLYDFGELYLSYNTNKIYSNERIRIISLSIYLKILVFELMSKEMAENEITPSEETILLHLTKIIRRDLLLLNKKILKTEVLEIDEQTKKDIAEDIAFYKKKFRAPDIRNCEKHLKY